MKKYLSYLLITLACIITCSFDSYGQEKKALLANINSEKDLYKKAKLLTELSYLYSNERKFDSAIICSRLCMDICQQHGFKDVLYIAYGQQGTYYNAIGNIQQSLAFFIKGLKTMEELGEKKVLPQILLNIGSTYFDLNDMQGCILNTKRAAIVAHETKDIFSECFALLALASYLNEIKQPDSSIIYNQQASILLKKLNDNSQNQQTLTAFSLANMGKINELNGDDEIARSYYRKSLELCSGNTIESDFLFIPYLCQQGLLYLDKKAGNPDSAIAHGLAALEIAKALMYPKQLQSSYKDLANLYSDIDSREALKYYKLESQLRDSLYNLKNISDIQNMKLQEEQRQEERLRVLSEQEQERKQIIEYSATGLIALLLIIIFLLLSRTIIVNEKLVRFLGVMSLLIVFEFINLLLHPFFGNITHHSPPLMLACMVGLASLLVPAHHKIEHWLLAKVIEKNKRIRLMAARKIIQELESETGTEKGAE